MKGNVTTQMIEFPLIGFIDLIQLNNNGIIQNKFT